MDGRRFERTRHARHPFNVARDGTAIVDLELNAPGIYAYHVIPQDGDSHEVSHRGHLLIPPQCAARMRILLSYAGADFFSGDHR